MLRTLLITTLAALPLSACMTNDAISSPNADRAQSTATQGSGMTPTEAMAYAKMAGAGDLYEIESSRLALTKTQNADLRQFANAMIEHHTKTTQSLTAAARSAGMNPPPPALMPMQQQMIAELRSASGAAFDTAYRAQQRKAHDMALALHRNYASRGDTAALRMVAATAVPVVEQHIAQLQRM